ncbi:histidine phosphatase family protein [Epibacterium sp. SM1969]|uniref:Histidine phosphatase family protein n=1 Tax=Tritonibacter aquimaris TaxID=2663379 RepID=A0A844ARS3_9RHOB|nr:histidine phosphatase family protein [Tritonibacter aquimaris]MQY43743.1 histidine phosphatase family protein [Tritonibacter aquimaris]
MTRFFLMRHGPTHAKSMVGWSDLPADLSDRAALARIEAYLPKDAIVVSSDLIRAIETASAIQGTRQRVEHDLRLRELHFGDWELRTWAELEQECPDHLRAFWETPGDVSSPNGESWNTLRARVDHAFDDLAQAYAGQNLVVVGHFGQILTQVQRAGRFTAVETLSHKIDNLSITEIALKSGQWQLGTINQIL